MRLHRLSLTAIGPFLTRTEVDFARFGERGLFLIEGATGSGKSTVIDAVSFALYGKVAQASAHSERLRSHHADGDVQPSVELVFETYGGLYRVRRTPSFERPKLRGSGMTKVSMTVKLWRLGSADHPEAGDLISNNLGDAEDEITRAIGLSHAQFVQTVVLPQGEFANFLQSGTDSKRILLQRLFGSEVTLRVQERLVEARQLAEKRRAAAAASVIQAAHAFVGAAGVGPQVATEVSNLADGGEHGKLIALVGEVWHGLRTAHARAGEQVRETTADRAAAERRWRQAQELLRRQDRRADLRAQRASLVAQRSDVVGIRLEIDAAERAAKVLPVADALGKAIARSEAAQDRAATARACLGADFADADRESAPSSLADADEGVLRSHCADLRVLAGELADDVDRERQLLGLRHERRRIEVRATDLEANVQRRRQELSALPDELNRLTAELATTAVEALRVTPLMEELARAEHRLHKARQAVAAERLAAQDEQITLAMLAACKQQELALTVLRSRWRTGIAGELGLALKAGEECAVCGSLEHPRPAAPASDHVSQLDIDAAESELGRSHRSVERCHAQLQRQRLELIELQVAADHLTPDRAQRRVAEVTEALTDARSAADRQRVLGDQLLTGQARITELGEQLRGDDVILARLAERASAADARIDDDERLVSKARGNHASVADRLAELTTMTAVLESTADAVREARVAVAAAIEIGDDFARALSTAGFDTQHAWQDSLRSEPEVSALRRTVQAFDEQCATVLANLADPELTDPVIDLPRPDLDVLAAQMRGADEAQAAAAAVHGSTSNRLTAAARYAEMLEHAAIGSATVLEQTAPAIRLGNLVDGLGDNQLRMQLTTYVLVRRFAEVVGAANAQLRRISGGRYELRHTSARSGNARSGLNLLVLDVHTGRTRDPGTLSGGETFYVSLALALGLADVVRSESGGVDLGTLFVDEGFGALDPEVLDEVLTVLDSLRSGGRVVGLVSHLTELKARIPDRIQVLRNPDGSSRLRITA